MSDRNYREDSYRPRGRGRGRGGRGRGRGYSDYRNNRNNDNYNNQSYDNRDDYGDNRENYREANQDNRDYHQDNHRDYQRDNNRENRDYNRDNRDYNRENKDYNRYGGGGDSRNENYGRYGNNRQKQWSNTGYRNTPAGDNREVKQQIQSPDKPSLTVEIKNTPESPTTSSEIEQERTPPKKEVSPRFSGNNYSERKSYSKDRRIRGGTGRTRAPEIPEISKVEDQMQKLDIKVDAPVKEASSPNQESPSKCLVTESRV